jgi:hypothetical protein
MLNEVVEFVNSNAEGAVVFPGCESALVGYAARINLEPVAVYSYNLLVGAHIEQGLNEEEAIEYVDYNIVGLWAGERTPVILYTP